MLLIADKYLLTFIINFMQNNRVLKLIMVHLLLMCFMFSFSHSKGHFHKGDGTIFNTWTLKNGTIIKGNFSMGKGEFIVLEQEAGRLLKIPISDFSLQDQLLANLKVKEYVKLNKEFIPILNTFSLQKKSGTTLTFYFHL